MEGVYIKCEWPAVQDLMEEPWFKDEAVPDNTDNSYLIPEDRIMSNDHIVDRVNKLANQFEMSDDDMLTIASAWDEPIPFEGGMTIEEAIMNIKININDNA